MPSADESLDDDSFPLRLERFIAPLQKGLLRFQRTGETYSFKVTGLSELNHKDLTTVC